jgi:hypothetical protein
MTKEDAVRMVAFAASIAYADALLTGESIQVAEMYRKAAFDREYARVERWIQ